MGFGRIGKMFVCNYVEISLDFMCFLKGIFVGYMFMLVVMIIDKIYNCFYGDYKELKIFIYSYIYSGNVMVCVIGVENLKIFEEDNIIKNNIKKGEFVKKFILERVEVLKYVGDVRSIGMIIVIELVKDKRIKEIYFW